MKVLITGGYGFIGSHVAERFHKEGYEVYIIDNLTTGNRGNISFKHRGYEVAVEDAKCEEVFRANQFEAVVHLAAQASVNTSIVNPRLDSESNVLGLVNMLNLAQKYNVKKFVFASSAAVYGTNDQFPLTEETPCDPISPYGISKLVGESYCRKWNELYGLETICFRFSNVYGPRQSSAGEGGVVSIFMDKLLSGQTLHVYGDGNQTRDFVYVEDVADAIFRASYSRATGVFNLSTETECSVNELITALGGLQSINDISYEERRDGDIIRSVLSNARLKRELDWSPMYGIAEGLRRTYAWFELNRAKQESAASATAAATRSPFRQMFKNVAPYAENLLAFGLTAWLTLSQPMYEYGAIDIKLFYITIIGIMYGKRQSIPAVVLSTGLYIYQKLAEGRELISLLYDTNVLFHIAIYLLIGLVVGYAIERKNAAIQTAEQEKNELEEKYDFLNGMYREVREVKDELQQRILNSGDSFGKIYSVTKELESLEPEQVFNSTVHVVKSIMTVQSVAIYAVNPYRTYMRLIAYSNGYDGQASIKVEDDACMRSVLNERKMFVNKELTSGAPLMCAPIFRNGEIRAVIAIDGLAFNKFSLYYQNLFKVTTDLVSSALARAFAYIEATESQRYVNGTRILRQGAFASILESKRMAKRNHDTPYLLLRVADGESGFEARSDLIANMLRETDYIGLNDQNEAVILLSNTGYEDAAPVLERFKGRGISLNILEEEHRND